MGLSARNPAPLGIASQSWRLPPGISTTTDRTPAITAHVTAWPFYFGAATTVDRLRISLTTAQAGGECMAGIYTNNGLGRPQTLIADLSTKDLSSGSGDLDYTISVPVFGWVWALIWLKNISTQVTIKGASASASFAENDSAGTTMSAPVTPKINLALTSAYPASMPVAAPAVVPVTTVSFIMPMLRAL